MSVRWCTVVAAVVAAVVVWLVAVPAAGVDLVATPVGGSTTHITFAAVLVATAVVALAGLGLLVLLERRSSKGLRIWTIIAAVVLAGSLGSPLGGQSTGAKVVLLLLHLVVGAVLIAGFRAGASRVARVRS